MSLNAGGSSPHFTDEGAGAPEGLRHVSGASPTCPHLRPCWVQSRLLLRSPGSTRLRESVWPRKLLPQGLGHARKVPAPAPEAPWERQAPCYFQGPPRACYPSHSGRHYPQTAAQKQLGGSWQESQGRQGYQLLSWPQLRTRSGQPLGPTCASRDFQAPTGPC